jgi:hypothetical protein
VLDRIEVRSPRSKREARNKNEVKAKDASQYCLDGGFELEEVHKVI